MARSHHRKKHKHWQPPPHTPKVSKGATSLFAIAGAVVGLAITYFASQGNIMVIIAGLLVGGAAGYYLGRKIDEGDSGK